MKKEEINNLIKYAYTDILNGLNCIKIGLNNIISYVLVNEESYTIELSITLGTIVRLIKCLVDNTQVVQQNDNITAFVSINDKTIKITRDEYMYTFQLI